MRPDDELDEELAAHLRMAMEERVARGEARRDAEWAARREFGNLTHIREVTREMRGGMGWERLRQDIAYGVRTLRNTPAFTAVALITLALGIGATSAVFTVVRGVLLRPLPFADPARLALISYLPTGLPMAIAPGLADRDFLEFRRRTTRFGRVATFAHTQVTLRGVGDAVRLDAASVTTDFFAVLGVSAARGRTFASEEAQEGGPPVVVLSDGLWRGRFAADPHIVGKSVMLDDAPHTVIGVAAPGFRFPDDAALWLPLDPRPSSHNSLIAPVIGRLRPGVTMAQARDELESIMRALPRARNERPVARVAPLKDLLTDSIRGPLLLLGGAVLFVLLIACVNVSNLLLIRGAARQQEMAVRAALGAARIRLVRQLLTESVIVGLVGGAAGIGVAALGVRVLLGLAPAGRLPRLGAIHLDLWVVAFTLGVSLAAGIAFGLAPAWHHSTRAPQEALGSGARRATDRHGAVRAAFAIAQVALATVLLTGAGLMVRSFQHRRSVDSGYHDAPLMTMSVDLPAASYDDVARAQAFHTALLRQLASLPGARSVGAVAWRPLSDAGIMGDFHLENGTALPPGYLVDKPAVSPGYFRTAGISLARGRDFSWNDGPHALPVAIVSASMARQIWPHGDPIGQRLTLADHPGPADWLTVVGVVGDVVEGAGLVRHPTLYLPYLQVTSLFFINHMSFVVRAGDERAAESLGPSMRAALRRVDPGLAAQDQGTLREHLSAATAEPLFESRLLGAFAALALVLAAVGTYGVLAYDVTARRHEIAIRMALGATPYGVMWLVLTRATLIAAVGLGLGVVGSLALTGSLRGLLYEVGPTDPATFGAVIGLMAVASLVAGWVPARRATRVDPLAALAEG